MHDGAESIDVLQTLATNECSAQEGESYRWLRLIVV